VTVSRRLNKKVTPWFNADCRAARRRARAAERRFKRSSSTTDYEAWSAELSKMKALYEEKTSTFWRNEISSSNGNSRRLWQTLQNVLGDATNDDDGKNTAAFFRDKVESVRASTMTTAPHDVRHRQTPMLECWTPVTTAEVEKLIASAPCKTCLVDPVPTWLIKDIKSLHRLLFNKSLASGHFPQDFTNAVVKPLLKKDGLTPAT